MTQAERRKYNRVSFKSPATLTAEKFQVDCKVVDLSIHGALVQLLTPVDIEPPQTFHLNIPLDNDGEHILMELKLTHQENDQLGLECIHIDLDSITHLRRLVELNLGDSELLERDFQALVNDNHATA